MAKPLVAAPISDNTSDADLPSTDVPSILRKSLSTTPDVKVATLPLDIPELGMSEVKATVPVVSGKVIVLSAVGSVIVKCHLIKRLTHRGTLLEN